MLFQKRTTIYFQGRVIFDTGTLFFIKTLWAVLQTPFKKLFWRVLLSAYANYFKPQYSSLNPINIALRADSNIPFANSAIRAYLSFVPYCLAAFVFIHKEFNGRLDREIAGALEDCVRFYQASGNVYRKFQTTMSPSNNSAGSVNILRLVDQNKNCFPSLHAQLVAKTYKTLEDACKTDGAEAAKYSQLQKDFFNHAVKILEACCATKQHSVQDLAAGLGLLSCLDKNFIAGDADKFMEGMFAGKLEPGIKQQIQSVMKNTYAQIIQKAGFNIKPDFPQICLEVIHENQDK